MGFFDFLTGSKRQTGTTRVVQDLPEELKPYVDDIMKDAKAFYDEQIEKGYQPYEGKTVAEFDPDELAAFEKLKSTVGIQDPYLKDYEEALGDYGGSLDEFRKSIEGIKTDMTAEGLKEYMSPYQQAVVDVQKRKASEDFAQRIMPEFEKQAIDAGGMSGLGSRAGVQAALLGSGQGQLLADIQAKGSQKAYEDAVKQFQYSQDAARQKAGDILGAEEARLGAAGERKGLGLEKFNIGLSEAGLLSEIGQQKRQRAQTLLDEAYARELEKREFVPSELARLSGFIYGSPYTTALSKTTTKSRPSASLGSQLLGAGLTGLNLYGKGGGFSSGGFSMDNLFSNRFRGSILKTGGQVSRGLRSLPVVKRSVGGGIGMGIDPYLTPGSMSPYGRQQIVDKEAAPESGEMPKSLMGLTSLTKAQQDKLTAEQNAARDTALYEDAIAQRDRATARILDIAGKQAMMPSYGSVFAQNLASSVIDPNLSFLEAFTKAGSKTEVDVEQKRKEALKENLTKAKVEREIAKEEVSRRDPTTKRTAQLKLRKLEREAKGLSPKMLKANFDKTKFTGSKEFESFRDRAISALQGISITKAEAEQLKKINPNLDDILEDPSDETKEIIALKVLEYTTNQGMSMQKAVMQAFIDALREGSAKED